MPTEGALGSPRVLAGALISSRELRAQTRQWGQAPNDDGVPFRGQPPDPAPAWSKRGVACRLAFAARAARAASAQFYAANYGRILIFLVMAASAKRPPLRVFA